MKKVIIRLALVVAGVSGVAHAQQDPQFTQFMYNKLIYNPGYAGTSGAICGVLQFRQQWAGYTGAPQTFAFSGDMRLREIPIGIGMNVMTDKVGPMSTFYFRMAGSYNLLKIAGGTLGIGLDLGIIQKSIVDNWITPEPLRNDPHIPGNQNNGAYSNPNLNKLSYDLGFGAFYQIPGKFYAGLSSSHLPAQTLTSSKDIAFKVTRHYYFMTGYTFQLNKWSKLTPNVLFKTDVAASSLDLNLTYLWSDMIWVGGTYRLDDAPAFMLGYQGKAMANNSLVYKIGYSYDLMNSKLSGYGTGTHEIILGVCYTLKKIMPTTVSDPRYLD